MEKTNWILLTAVIVILILVVLLLRLWRRHKRIRKALEETDLSNRRLMAALQYIPYTLLLFETMEGRFFVIDKQTGKIVQRRLGDGEQDLSFPSLKNYAPELKERMLSGEETVVKILEGYSGAQRCYGKLTSNVVYNSFGSPVQAVCILEDVTDTVGEQAELKERLENAKRDTLTSLYTKGVFLEDAQRILTENPDSRVGIVFVDLDNFKLLNDSLGHIEGDKVIQETAMRLRNVFDKQDIIARFGGDEFCVLIKDADRDKLQKRLGMLIDRQKQTYGKAGNTVQVSSSVGAVIRRAEGRTIESLLEEADAVLYQAKKAGKGRYIIETEEENKTE